MPRPTQKKLAKGHAHKGPLAMTPFNGKKMLSEMKKMMKPASPVKRRPMR